MLWHARYWLARWLFSAGLFVLPRGRYRNELLEAMYALKWQCIVQVTVARALAENSGDKLPPELPRAHAPILD